MRDAMAPPNRFPATCARPGCGAHVPAGRGVYVGKHDDKTQVFCERHKHDVGPASSAELGFRSERGPSIKGPAEGHNLPRANEDLDEFQARMKKRSEKEACGQDSAEQ
jgi:hypothetical protein